ncbi:MAG: hypothetical protein HY754_03055 [Nitrospirae bacterium]|nr:hypothetical protein [Nitrospirota bacterium]
MGKEESLKTKLIQSVINYVRSTHAEAIDKAYEYFWDEKSPDEFLKGTALTLGFINFEDWLIFDYKANDKKETFIDIYIRNNKELKAEERSLLDRIKGSRLSLYEVASVSKDKKIIIKDLLVDGDISLRHKTLTRGLKKGDLLATRILTLNGNKVMSGCVYPFRKEDKKAVLHYIDRMIYRYKKNENQDGTMETFLKDYGDIFNIIWINLILNEDNA